MLFFYENYVRLCNSVGKTPSAVAKEIGIQKSTVTRWKNGKGRTDATVQKVADYFGVSKSFLLNSTPEPEEIIMYDDISGKNVNDTTERRIISFENRQKETPTLSKEDERKEIMDFLDDLTAAELVDLMAKASAKLKEKGVL